jgi:hypothetical protein
MKKNSIKQLIINLIIFVIILQPVFAVSPAVKSYDDFDFLLNLMRNMKIMVENFGDESVKLKFNDAQTLFQSASELYYGHDFTNSEIKYMKLKKDMIFIMEALAQNYLKRTKDILDSTSKDTFDILITYGKNSALADYFKRPFDPLNDIKAWEPQNYHYFHDKQKMENYLRYGYKNYQMAKNIFRDPELEYLKKKESLQSKNMNYILKRYGDVIELCRDAKECGIELHRVKNTHEIGKIVIKYNLLHGTVRPIMDDRIPQNFKVDANDNKRFIHSIEEKWLAKKMGRSK